MHDEFVAGVDFPSDMVVVAVEECRAFRLGTEDFPEGSRRRSDDPRPVGPGPGPCPGDVGEVSPPGGSFGLEGRDNECGGVYSVKPPAVNMCLPPLAWQTYDIDVTAPRFEGGRKVKNARMTVRHNGVVIHDDIEIAKVTPGGVRGEEGPTGPLFLQDHGNPVRYRSIWVLPRKPDVTPR